MCGRVRLHMVAGMSSGTSVTADAVSAARRGSLSAWSRDGMSPGIAARTPETSSRCVFTPYGVQVISVTRSSPSTILSPDVSSGSMTPIRSTR